MLACVNVTEGTCYRLMVRRNEKCIGVIILCTHTVQGENTLAVSRLVAKMENKVENAPVFKLQGS